MADQLVSNTIPQAPTSEQSPEQKQAQERIIQNTRDALSRMLAFRRQYDQRRLLWYKQYVSRQDGKFFPDGVTPRSNTFIPYPYSNVETVVSRVQDVFFGTPDWFDCIGAGQADDAAAESMGAILKRKLKQAKLPQAFELFARNVCIYGHGAIKIDWDWDYDVVNYLEPIPAIDPNTGQPIVDPTSGQPIIIGQQPATKSVPRARPKFTAIDVFDFLSDPDLNVKAHLVEKTLGQLKREAQANPELYYPEGITELIERTSDQKDPDQIIVRIAELWDTPQQTCTVIVTPQDRDALAWKDLRMSFRQGTKSTYQRRIYGGPEILLWHGPNQFNHKRCPILDTSYVKLSGDMFGIGVIESISALSESMNTFINMIVDNWNLGINRRYAYDLGSDIDHEALNNFNTPGGKVGVTGDPHKVIADLPFMTPAAGDYEVLGIYKGMIEMTSGISDFYQKGIGSPTGNDTATGIQSVIGESGYRFKLFMLNLSNDVLVPLLEMCASLVQQFISDEQEVQITDQEAMIPKWHVLKPEELVGSFSFDLVGANYATNKVVRQRNLMALVNVVGQSAFWNEYEALKEIAKVFEVRNIHRILKTPEIVQQEQQAAQQQALQQVLLEHEMELEKMYYQAIWGSEAKARIEAAKPRTDRRGSSNKVGRPAHRQFEGKIPGSGLTSQVRSFAQNMGANALGLEGLSEISQGT